MKRTSRIISALIIVILGSARMFAQGDYPSAQEVLSALKGVENSVRDYERIDDKIDVNSLKAPPKLVDSVQTQTQEVRSTLRQLEAQLKTIEASRRWSAVDLLQVDGRFETIRNHYRLLLNLSEHYSGLETLPSDSLVEFAMPAMKAQMQMKSVLARTLRAQDAELSACRLGLPK